MERMKLIAGTIICQDEEDLILGCLENIYPWVDELIIIDGGSKDKTVDIIKKFRDEKEGAKEVKKIKLFSHPFDGHFGDQKNLAISKTNAIWVLSLDADERLPTVFYRKMREHVLEALLSTNKEGEHAPVDVFAFPRINLIDGEKTDVYPDYQLRLFRSYCRYCNAVHEELTHFDIRIDFPDEYAMLHEKKNIRQTIQDRRYQRIRDLRCHQVRNLNIMETDERIELYLYDLICKIQPELKQIKIPEKDTVKEKK